VDSPEQVPSSGGAAPPSLVAAYGIYYLDNRPTLLRALDLAEPPSPDRLPAILDACRRWGFNAIRAPASVDLDNPTVEHTKTAIAGAGIAWVGTHSTEGGAATIPPLPRERGPGGEVGPFHLSLAAARQAATATDDHPATLWRIPSDPLHLLTAIGRGIRGYSLPLAEAELANTSNPVLEALRRLQAWLGEHEEELAASVELRDTLALVDYAPIPRESLPEEESEDIDGAFGALAAAGYNPTVFDLRAADDPDLTEYAAAVFPCGGRMDLQNYGKLVVYALRGGSLVTFPRPVTADPDGAPYRTDFLWPKRVEAPLDGARAQAPRQVPKQHSPQSQVGYRVQVREGTSALVGADFGEPFASEVYFRLPAEQRLAIRRLVLALLDDPAPRQIIPDDAVEVEVVARLSPDGGALLFVANRLGPQVGALRFPALGALNLAPGFTATVEYSAHGSSAVAVEDVLRLDLAAGDGLVLRLCQRLAAPTVIPSAARNPTAPEHRQPSAMEGGSGPSLRSG
jgi:hypothetical protein